MPKVKINSPLIDKLYADLQQEFPHLTIERTDSSIRILPNAETGFVVALVDAIQEVVPVFGDWCNYGLGEEEAIPIFQAGLRGEARLHEISRAGVAYHWNVEFFRDGVWVKERNDYYEPPFFTWPFLFFWRKKERVLWNAPGRLR
jgi:hypothetical protein